MAIDLVKYAHNPASFEFKSLNLSASAPPSPDGLSLEKKFRELFDLPVFQRRLLAENLFPLKPARLSNKKNLKCYTQLIESTYSHSQELHQENFKNPSEICRLDPIKTTDFDLTQKEVVLSKPARSLTALSITKYKIIRDSMIPWGQELVQKVTFTFSDKKESFFLLKEKIPEETLPPAIFNGNEVETRFGPQKDDVPIEPSFWNKWEKYDPNAADIYTNIIHPAIIDAAERISLLFGGDPIRVLDIGGGTGDLSLLIAENPYVGSVTNVEKNEVSAALAKRRAQCQCEFRSLGAKKKITVHQGDITQKKTWDSFPNESCELIILCGVVAHQVLSRQDSITLLNRIKPLLIPGGFVIIASQSPPHFDSQTLGRLYTVLNRSSFYIESPSSTHKEAVKTGNWTVKTEPLYVLRKDS